MGCSGWKRSRSKVALPHQLRNHLVWLECLIHSSNRSNEAALGRGVRSWTICTLFWWRWWILLNPRSADRPDVIHERLGSLKHAIALISMSLVLWDEYTALYVLDEGFFLLFKHNSVVHSGVSLTSAFWTSLTHAELVEEHAKHMWFKRQIWRPVRSLRENTCVSRKSMFLLKESKQLQKKLPESKRSKVFIVKQSQWLFTPQIFPLHTHTKHSMFVSLGLKAREQLRFDAVFLLIHFQWESFSVSLVDWALRAENPGKHTETDTGNHVLDCDWSVVSFWALNCVQRSILPFYDK